MASASFVEIISHFAGYLQIFHDIARDRIAYDESLAPRPTGDYTTLRPNYDYRFVPDDMETAAGPVPELTPDDPIHFLRGRPLKLLHGPQDEDFDFFPREMAGRSASSSSSFSCLLWALAAERLMVRARAAVNKRVRNLFMRR